MRAATLAPPHRTRCRQRRHSSWPQRARRLPLPPAALASLVRTTAMRLVKAADQAAVKLGATRPAPASAAARVRRAERDVATHLPPGVDADTVTLSALDVIAWWESGAGRVEEAGPASGRRARTTALANGAALAAASLALAAAAAAPAARTPPLDRATLATLFDTRENTVARAEAGLRRSLAAAAATLPWLPPPARTPRGVHAALATAVAASAAAAGIVQPTLARIKAGAAEDAGERVLPAWRPPAEAAASRADDDDAGLSSSYDDDDDIIADGEWDAYVRKPEEVALLLRLEQAGG